MAPKRLVHSEDVSAVVKRAANAEWAKLPISPRKVRAYFDNIIPTALATRVRDKLGWDVFVVAERVLDIFPRSPWRGHPPTAAQIRGLPKTVGHRVHRIQVARRFLQPCVGHRSCATDTPTSEKSAAHHWSQMIPPALRTSEYRCRKQARYVASRHQLHFEYHRTALLALCRLFGLQRQLPPTGFRVPKALPWAGHACQGQSSDALHLRTLGTLGQLADSRQHGVSCTQENHGRTSLFGNNAAGRRHAMRIDGLAGGRAIPGRNRVSRWFLDL